MPHSREGRRSWTLAYVRLRIERAGLATGCAPGTVTAGAWGWGGVSAVTVSPTWRCRPAPASDRLMLITADGRSKRRPRDGVPQRRPARASAAQLNASASRSRAEGRAARRPAGPVDGDGRPAPPAVAETDERSAPERPPRSCVTRITVQQLRLRLLQEVSTSDARDESRCRRLVGEDQARRWPAPSPPRPRAARRPTGAGPHPQRWPRADQLEQQPRTMRRFLQRHAGQRIGGRRCRQSATARG